MAFKTLLYMFKNNPLVSIVVPVYNEEKYLESCIRSLIQQVYKPFEIIIIDDGSSDKSMEIAKKFPVKILKQIHKGPGAARNKGVHFSKGKIIVLADADMRYDKNYIKFLIKPILKNQAVGTFVKEEYVANPENIWSKCWSINSGLPFNRRLPKDYKDRANAFRAILRTYFMKGGGYETDEGYTDDSSLSKKINKDAINAKGAKSYHYNPSTLSEVYYSARWIGRSNLFSPTIVNLLRYSFANSIRVGIKYLLKKAPIQILIFKIVFDFGMFSGIFLSGKETSK